MILTFIHLKVYENYVNIINIMSVNGVFSKITLVGVFAYSRAHSEKRSLT